MTQTNSTTNAAVATQTAIENITEQSKALFIAYAEDSGNWSGTPMVGGNVGGSRADNGNLTDLKKHGLVETFRSDRCDFVSFTEKGREYARSIGLSENTISAME